MPNGHIDAVRTPSERPNRPGVRTPSRRASEVALIKALQEHVATLKEELAGASARPATADAERAKAIAAFTALAERLDALAAQRRPWWRRLAG